jgi:asparagine synthase (glutamine-hydrolysing)
MCGIAGYWACGSRDAALDADAIVSAMADQIRHRGPDDHGAWFDTDAGYAVAHRRLSILDVSAAGHQPMHSASGRWVLAYNGELYNHLDLREQLQGAHAAPAWRGHSDTESLLAAVEAWGVCEAVGRSVGMFAFALWDRAERALWLARDRMGEKPLYYGWQRGTFLFGSELKALRAHPTFDARVDRGALTLLLRHNYVPDPYSIYAGIRKLPPGTLLCVKPGRGEQTPTPYWSLTEAAERGMAKPFRGSATEALEDLEQHLGAAVRGQMLSDVPLGALLSGGVDSSLITALMQASSARPVRTFTIGVAEGDYDESAHARAVAAHLGTDHTDLRLTGAETLALVPHIAAMYDEPFADPSQLPTHVLMKLARARVSVALSGDAGDELFGGYSRYRMAPRAWAYVEWMPAALRRASGAALTALSTDTINRVAGPLARRAGVVFLGERTHKLGLRLQQANSIDDLYVALVSEWTQAQELVVGGDMPPNLLDDRAHWPALADPVARMMALDCLTYLPGNILTKADRASMAVSLETRAPLLDRHVVEFVWSLPMHMKLRAGQGKWLLRQLLYRHVPRALVDRPKIGFGVPLNRWLRGPLREWAEALLAQDRLRRDGFFNPEPIRAAWRQHVSGQASLGNSLWSILMFQAWLDGQTSVH